MTNARDPCIRTVRIDRSLRGVALAPESGDEYCLLTVLPHDDAYRCATSRTFSVNQALGVLEVRNQTRLDEIAPTLRTVAEDSDKRLFDAINDADLTRLGIDADLLPLIRLLTDDTHLEALARFLPAPQYDALVALASGMSIGGMFAPVLGWLADAHGIRTVLTLLLLPPIVALLLSTRLRDTLVRTADGRSVLSGRTRG